MLLQTREYIALVATHLHKANGSCNFPKAPAAEHHMVLANNAVNVATAAAAKQEKCW
jgi:hypothetical protein